MWYRSRAAASTRGRTSSPRAAPCNTKKANHLPDECGMHLLHQPVEPHFVHLSWAVRRLTPTQAKYIRMFYGAEVLHQIEALEHRGLAHPNSRAASGERQMSGRGERRAEAPSPLPSPTRRCSAGEAIAAAVLLRAPHGEHAAGHQHRRRGSRRLPTPSAPTSGVIPAPFAAMPESTVTAKWHTPITTPGIVDHLVGRGVRVHHVARLRIPHEIALRRLLGRRIHDVRASRRACTSSRCRPRGRAASRSAGTR